MPPNTSETNASEWLGRYRLIAPMAQGGMAEIFLARHQGPGGFEKDVVVKRVHPHMAQDPQFIAMFLDEARLAARLSHPNIVQVTDFGQVGDTYFLCMERLEGADLASVLRAHERQGRFLPLPVVAVIASAICEGLHYAHTLADERGRPLGIVHRDLSPSNVFVTKQGAVKLLDFGIAKARGRAVQTLAGQIKGKILYMSPEQARAEEVDARSDLFALGSILYELLTGVRPFKRGDMAASLAAVSEGHAAPPKSVRADLPDDLDAIVRRALQPERGARYQTAEEMRRDLDQYLASCTSISPTARLHSFMLELEPERAPESSGTATQPAQPTPEAAATVAGRRPARAEPAGAANPTVRMRASGSRATPAPSSGDNEVGPLFQSAAGEPRARWPWLAGGAVLAVAVAVGAVLALREPPPPAPAAEASDAEVPAANAPVGQASGSATTPNAALSGATGNTQSPVAQSEPAADARPVPVSPMQQRWAEKAAGLVARAHHDPEPSVAVPAGAGTPAPNEVTGMLDVDCAPRACRIYIDKQDTGRSSPIQGLKLRVGPHVVTVVDPEGQVEQEREILIVPGATVRHRFEL